MVKVRRVRGDQAAALSLNVMGTMRAVVKSQFPDLATGHNREENKEKETRKEAEQGNTERTNQSWAKR